MLELAFPDGSCKFFKEISFQHVFLLTMPYGMWHLSSSTRDHTHNLCIGNGESLPLGCQGNPLFFFFFFNFILYWGVFDLQCCVSFRYKARWFSYTYTCIHSFSDSDLGFKKRTDHQGNEKIPS